MRGSGAPVAEVLHLRGAADASFEILARPASSTAGAHVIAYVFATPLRITHVSASSGTRPGIDEKT